MTSLTRPTNGRFGALFVGLDATPTGSAAGFDVVADFTGATQTDFGDASNAAPITPVHSQTDGSQFRIGVRGVWRVSVEIPVATAATVQAAINVDGQAADFSTDPAATNTRNVRRGVWTGAAAGDADTIQLSADIRVTQTLADGASTGTGGVVRILLSNGAGTGATAASLAPLASARVDFQWIGDLPPG